jgi:EAL domain-containing protein (putative c-di-GMP-specific phosphodiesterase class I)/GGDEF domain-containing protein
VKASRGKILRYLLVLIFFVVSLALVGSSMLSLSGFSSDMEEQAGVKGMLYASDTATHLKSAVEAYKAQIAQMARLLENKSYKDQDDFTTQLRAVSRTAGGPNLMYARYFRDGVEYTVSGQEFPPTMESKPVMTLAQRRYVSCAGVVSDRQYSISTLAFCAPVNGNAFADAIVLFFPVNTLADFSDSLNEEALADSRVTTLCTEEGEVLSLLHQTDMGLQEHNNIYEQLRGQVNDKSVIDGMHALVSAGASGAYPVQIGGENHVVSVSSIKEDAADPFAIVSVFRSTDIHNAGYFTISTVIGELVIFFLLLIAAMVVLAISRYRQSRRFTTVQDIDHDIDCPTRQKFEKDAADILSRNKATAFAITVIDVRHFSYFTDQLGADAAKKITLFLKLIYTRILTVDEAIGYLGGGRFVLMLHYRTVEALATRLKGVTTLATAYNGRLPSGNRLTLYGGVYQTDHKLTDDVSKMIDMAIDAKDVTNAPYDFGNFRCYNERIHTSQAQTEYIETRQEMALENKEFRLFFQPTYNLVKKQMDGCEALVRWYNAEKDDYMQPGVFLPLFEANRFIIKLDHYVYEQVCQYIHDCVTNRQPVRPISVNVSRVTAMEPDFAARYIEIKKKFVISNGMISLEFPESFANEDYEGFRKTVTTLHQNGFKCAIDDFGSGYSSYTILKELPMDEIKLDRLFLNHGIDPQRDRQILAGVIQVARELNMKVTQKGVETDDQRQMLAQLGCNTIQGYQYSKPLVLSDYIEFIHNAVQDAVFESLR